MKGLQRWLLICSPILLFAVTSCSSSKTTAPTETADVIAPFVVSIVPGVDDTGVAVNANITVVFSEAMDQTSHTGNVTISSGTINSMTWSDSRTLVIVHSGWAEGVEVDVAVTAGLADVAGNALAAVFNANFWTTSSVVELLSSNPVDGFLGVQRNPQILMLFSHDMNLTTLNSALTVTNVTLGGTVAFTLASSEGTWIGLTFPATLDASTPYRVDISTAAQSQGGTNLATAASFTFTTGADIDVEAPTIVSMEPANGSTIDANTGSIRFTFSESIDINDFSPNSMSAQLWMLMAEVGEPTWSENNTVVTVGVPTPLPAGLPMTVNFASYQDPAGNVQTTPLNYSVTVAGTADFFPLVDGTVYEYMEDWTDTGAAAPEASGSGPLWMRIEADAVNGFRLAEYDDEGLTNSHGWEYYRPTATTVDFVGFHDKDEFGVGSDMLFTTPITYNKKPWLVQSWNGNTSVPTSEGTMDVSYTVSVLLQEDVAVQGNLEETDLVWKNCWKVTLDYALSSGGESQGSGTDTMWFAPTIGIVQRSSIEIDGASQYTSDEYLVTP